MEKIKFALDVDDDWPPVATESVWCQRIDSRYELKNAPFFIRGLAFGDKFRADPDPVNGCIFEFEVTEPSGHSLVWVLNNDDLDFGNEKRQLKDIGCRIEGFPAFKLYSIDVPAAVDSAAVNALVDKIGELGFSLAFPVWRHEVENA